jgi:2-dehydro-3-deoxyphosphooctonate aldolase (KDO 8-P synthase)
LSDDSINDLWDQGLAGIKPLPRPVEVGPIRIGDGSLAVIAGPCSIESEDLCLSVAEHLVNLCADLGLSYIFKASFDKANRTAIGSFRGHGIEAGLSVLQKVKDQFGVPILTDIHETSQVEAVASVVDVLQIPAFLCRQTDLLVACGGSGRTVNIKKGQFMAPDDMKYAAEKVASTHNQNILLTERGALFGYRDLVVDMRSLVTMRSTGYPVIFDATHSVQQMGGAGGSSGGLTEFIPAQVRGAVAVGVDALFIETHPDPGVALSDGSTMVPLSKIRSLLEMAKDVHSVHGRNGD